MPLSASGWFDSVHADRAPAGARARPWAPAWAADPLEGFRPALAAENRLSWFVPAQTPVRFPPRPQTAPATFEPPVEGYRASIPGLNLLSWWVALPGPAARLAPAPGPPSSPSWVRPEVEDVDRVMAWLGRPERPGVRAAAFPAGQQAQARLNPVVEDVDALGAWRGHFQPGPRPRPRPAATPSADGVLQTPADDSALQKGWLFRADARPLAPRPGQPGPPPPLILLAPEDALAKAWDLSPTARQPGRPRLSPSVAERTPAPAPEEAPRGVEVLTVAAGRLPDRPGPGYGVGVRPDQVPYEDALWKGWDFSPAATPRAARARTPASAGEWPGEFREFVSWAAAELPLTPSRARPQRQPAGEVFRTEVLTWWAVPESARPRLRAQPGPAAGRVEAWPLDDDVTVHPPCPPGGESPRRPDRRPVSEGATFNGPPAGVIYVDQLILPWEGYRPAAPARPARVPGDSSGRGELTDHLAWRPGGETGRPVVLPRPVRTGDRDQPPGFLDPHNTHGALEYTPPGLPLPRPRGQGESQHALPGWLIVDQGGRAWLVPEQLPHPLPRPVLAGEQGRCLDPSPVLGLTWALPALPLPRTRPFPAGQDVGAPPIAVGLVVVAGPYYVSAADVFCAGATAGEVFSS